MSAPLVSDTGDGLDSWRARVLTAQAENDEAGLGRLYAELVEMLGVERASHAWLGVMSGWDANAITG